MNCRFYVGQKVVCVDVKPTFIGGQMCGLKLGNIYTIRGIRIDCEEELVVHLEEIQRGLMRDSSEYGFRAARFRPMVATDISVFMAMLAPQSFAKRDHAKEDA